MSSIPQDVTELNTAGPHRGQTATRDEQASSESFWDLISDEALAYPAVDGHLMDFRVTLDLYRGPMDLLLYLVKKHELDVNNIQLAVVTEQFLAYLEVLEHLDVDEVGDFVEVASLLIEIKSRMVLPQVDEEESVVIADDPREELVQRLLEYKKYKDAASMLGESGHEWQQHYPRAANDLPPRTIDPTEQPIHEVELWDLVSAMGRIMRDTQKTQAAHIVYDDTPIHVYMQQIHERLLECERVSFTGLFEPGMHKSKMIGVFLAVLELARNYGVVVEQPGLHSDMWLTRSDDFVPSLDVSEVFSEFEAEPVPTKPR